MLEVDERREDFEEGEGEREVLAALGDRDRCASEAGVEARELALLKGSDFARMRLRLRARSRSVHRSQQSALAAYIYQEG